MEAAPRLKAEIWVKALIRRCETEGASAMVVRRGDAGSGIVLVKLNTLDGMASVFAPARDGEGNLIWMRAPQGAPVPEPEADTYIEKQRRFDPDIWVVEIEDRQGRHFLQEPVG
ncbi:hypothetical protein FHS78_002782 [Parvibaculum indicum]|uniref:DUF1491 family protein n=1 Tax=Parvibaculum indicum TaxID=562969 RepID=UPI00142459D9|nr:DUF1491 family protein [Parvibaculum indicum]NIJ42480.1 hypothetical protein [Parvibaculum indicum]